MKKILISKFYLVHFFPKRRFLSKNRIYLTTQLQNEKRKILKLELNVSFKRKKKELTLMRLATSVCL